MFNLFKKEEVKEVKEPKIIRTFSITLLMDNGWYLVFKSKEKNLITQLEINIQEHIKKHTAIQINYSCSRLICNQLIVYKLDIGEKDIEQRIVIPFPNKIASLEFEEMDGVEDDKKE